MDVVWYEACINCILAFRLDSLYLRLCIFLQDEIYDTHFLWFKSCYA